MKLEDLGRRICIIGPSSSGKSTLADSLGKKLNIDTVTHLDLLAHIPNTNWLRRPDDEFVAEHSKVIAQDEWVIDGNYSVCMKERLSRATSVIWLDYSPYYSVFSFIKRSLIKETRIGMLEGSKEKINLALIKHTLRQYPKNKKKYKEYLADFPNLPVIYIKSMRELDKLRIELNLPL